MIDKPRLEAKCSTADVLETFLPAVHHEPIFVQLTGE